MWSLSANKFYDDDADEFMTVSKPLLEEDVTVNTFFVSVAPNTVDFRRRATNSGISEYFFSSIKKDGEFAGWSFDRWQKEGSDFQEGVSLRDLKPRSDPKGGETVLRQVVQTPETNSGQSAVPAFWG